MMRKTLRKRKTEPVERGPSKPIARSVQCLFCNREFDDDSKLSQEQCTKLFEAACMFLNINTSGEQEWNFEEEPFPFCLSCTGHVQEFGISYNELEVVHCKIARVVETVKQVVTTGPAGKTKRVQGSTTSRKVESKIKAFRQQLRATLRQGVEEGDNPSTLDGDFASSPFKKDNFCSKAFKPSRKSVESNGADIIVAATNVEGCEAAVKSEANGENSSSEDEFEAYIREQLEKRKAKIEDNEDEEIPYRCSKRIEETVCDEDDDCLILDATEVCSGTESLQPGPVPESVCESEKDVHIRMSNALMKANISSTGSTRTTGYGTVVGQRYLNLINAHKPNTVVSSLSNEGFLYGGIRVLKTGKFYRCSLCPQFKASSDENILLDHVETAHIGDDHWYPCEYCVLSFRLVTQLLTHQKSAHVGMKDRKWTLMCSICSKRFFDQEMANLHTKSHRSNVNKEIQKLSVSEKVQSGSTLGERKVTTDEENAVLPSTSVQLRPRKPKSPDCIDVLSGSDGGSDQEGAVYDENNPCYDEVNEEQPTAINQHYRSPVQNVVSKQGDHAPRKVIEVLWSTEIPLNKLVLCGGCGCRYFSESEAAVSTIKKHAQHHRKHRAFACRLCSLCFTTLKEMVDHVRKHSMEERFRDYIFYSPFQSANEL